MAPDRRCARLLAFSASSINQLSDSSLAIAAGRGL
jgi:DNA-binding transcriptional regulator YdaS (Cro superfamily)